jgi:hypothetical protein
MQPECAYPSHGVADGGLAQLLTRNVLTATQGGPTHFTHSPRNLHGVEAYWGYPYYVRNHG